MTLAGLQPDRVTFLALLSTCCDPSELKRGEELHSRIKSGMIADDFLGAALISMYSRCGDIKRAMEVFEELQAVSKRGGVGRWNAMIGALTKAGENERALKLFDRMVAEGIQPNVVTFVAVLPACGNTGDLKKGKEIHALIKRSGIPIEEFLGATLITMYGDCGDSNEAVSVFNGEAKRGISTWNSMIGVLAKSGRAKEALNLFEEMLRLKEGEGTNALQPDAITFLAALSACGDIGDLQKAKEIHSLISKMGILIDDSVSAALISMYSKCGEFEKAMKVFDTIEVGKKGHSSWNAFIGALAKEGKDSAALAAFEDMLASKIEPTLVTFLAVLSACREAETLKKGKDIHSLILKKGIPIDGFLGAALISMYSRCGDIEEAMRVFESEIKAKVPANSVDSWNAIIAAGARQGENMKALAIY